MDRVSIKCCGFMVLAFSVRVFFGLGLEPVAGYARTDQVVMSHPPQSTESRPGEKQITRAPHGHILTSTGVWSPDSEWIVYDTRSDPAGAVFDGTVIEMVNIHTGVVRKLYRSLHGAHCGVATFNPSAGQVIFIGGPEYPTVDWQYGSYHRQGLIVDITRPGHATFLDARDLSPPFTPGALRGGSHVHVFSADGQWVSFTYEDHVLAQFAQATTTNDINLRNVGVAVRVGPVQVKKDHPRNHDAAFFSVVVTRTTAHPQPGSDNILKACEEGWVGTDGYRRLDGSRQKRALAFQGTVVTDRSEPIAEVFLVDLPDDVKIPGDGPLAGTEFRLPFPPRGTGQRRLTHTANRPYRGLQGPRHWLRSSPDGSQIAFLMKDDSGIVQVWTVSPNGGPPMPMTHNPWSVASAFTWSPDGRRLAYIMDNSVFVTETATGTSIRLTSRCPTETAPRPEACVFSPDGAKIAYVRPVRQGRAWFNQVFVVFMKTPPGPD